MKICVFCIIQIFPFIVKVGDWALRWTEGNAVLQIVFVMLLFPLIMNAIQYYIIDTFIKKQIVPDHDHHIMSQESDEDIFDDDDRPTGPLLTHLSDDGLPTPEFDNSQHKSVHVSSKDTDNNMALNSRDYDPSTDGDVIPIAPTRENTR